MNKEVEKYQPYGPAWEQVALTRPKTKLVSLLRDALLERDQLRAVPPAPAAAAGVGIASNFGTRLLPAENGPGDKLHGDYLYVLLPDNSVEMAMWTDFNTDYAPAEAWGHYTTADYIEPLPVQPTHYFTPPCAAWLLDDTP